MTSGGIFFAFAVVVALGIAKAAPAVAWEDAFRCGVGLVNVGDSEQTVIDKCGPPTKSTRKTIRRRGVTTVLDEWTYDFGSTQFVRVLTFNGTLDRLLSIITRGDYGT